MLRALDSLTANVDSRQEHSSEHIIVSQQANSESKIAQFTGEVLEEATRILVEEFGMVYPEKYRVLLSMKYFFQDILPMANEVINKWKNEEEEAISETTTQPSDSNRSKRNAVIRPKRQANNRRRRCFSPPTDCNNRFQ